MPVGHADPLVRSSATTRRSRCASRRSREFAELMGVRRKYRESIEQCLDEMLMNALYDAPVDEQGKPDLLRDPDEDADLAARRAEGRRAVRVRRHAVRDRGARRVRHARARDRAALPPQVPARRAADRSQGRRRGPRPVPDGELVDDGLLQRAARRRDRGGVHVRPRDAEAAARDVRLLHRADRRRRAGSPPGRRDGCPPAPRIRSSAARRAAAPAADAA